MGNDARRRIGHGLVDIHGWFTLAQDSVDKLVGNKTVRALVAAIVPQRFGQQVRFPPLHFREGLDPLRRPLESPGVFFG